MWGGVLSGKPIHPNALEDDNSGKRDGRAHEFEHVFILVAAEKRSPVLRGYQAISWSTRRCRSRRLSRYRLSEKSRKIVRRRLVKTVATIRPGLLTFVFSRICKCTRRAGMDMEEPSYVFHGGRQQSPQGVIVKAQGFELKELKGVKVTMAV